MSDFDQARIVSLMGDAGEAPPRAVAAVQRFGLQALVAGRPAHVTEISTDSGPGVETIRAGMDALIRAGRIETDGDTVHGVGGLTVTQTVHTLELPDAPMHTWCALDAIGVPVAFGLSAAISTTCPHCGARLHVAVGDAETPFDESIKLFCPTGPCNDVRADICSSANLFCDSDHVTAWRAANPSIDGHELDLDETAELGRARLQMSNVGWTTSESPAPMTELPHDPDRRVTARLGQ